MDTLETLFAADLSASNYQAVVRLLVAALLAMVIGLDREARRKPAGLRSHMLVSLAAALLTIVTFRMADAASQLGEAVNADPLRIVEAVVAGVAFLGAGTIIRGRGRDGVQGITTGASLWLAGGLGVACGSGHHGLAAVATAVGLFILFVLGQIERRMQDAVSEAKRHEDAA